MWQIAGFRDQILTQMNDSSALAHAMISLTVVEEASANDPERKMSDELIHDRGRGPEILGTRITVYNLLPHFLDPTATESQIGRLYELTPEQVAAARAYVLNHLDTVLVEHLKIEDRLAAGNPPEVIEQAKQTKAAFASFSRWLAERDQAKAQDGAVVTQSDGSSTSPRRFPTFHEWLAEQESRPGGGS
jgi:uncharacterized protein (DUF433 family)